MVLLIHHPADVFSRKIRIAMSEKKMLFSLKLEEPWSLSQEALRLNPAGGLPILVSDGNVITSNYALSEFLDEVRPDIPLLFGNIKQKAEIRRVCEWFDVKFFTEVYKNIAYEKINKRFGSGLAPDSKVLKIGLNNLNYHLEYLEWLLEKNAFLASDNISLADISASASISLLDYLGDIPWEKYKTAKLWYSKIKSRPSFKEILKDSIKGILPSKHYTNLDF